MSRTVDEWIGKTDDTTAPLRVKARIVARQNGICACGCGTKLGIGERIEFDHTTPLILGGANSESNLRALRAMCHKVKTAVDVAQKSIEARKRAKHLGLRPARKAALPCGKSSEFKRRIDGTIVRRNEAD
jgi:5-methylcytosine-specific restriction endonuclease McrA